MNREAEEQFNQCYAENFEYISRYCHSRLSNYPELAEDCVQETFRVLFEKLNSGAEIKYSRAFLTKTAYNYISKKYREIETAKAKNVPLEAAEPLLPYEQRFFEEVSEETILHLRDEILCSLTNEEKYLLISTSRLNGRRKTGKQLAEEYQCSPSTIRKRRRELKAKIRALAKEKTKDL